MEWKCHFLKLSIIFGKKTRHTTMSLTRRKRSLIVSKSMLKEQGNYMGHNPKRVLGTWGSNPR